MDPAHVSERCRGTMRQCFERPDVRIPEDTEFLPTLGPNGTYIRLSVEPCAKDGGGKALAISKIVTPISPELLDRNYRMDCVLRSLGLPRAWVLRKPANGDFLEPVRWVTNGKIKSPDMAAAGLPLANPYLAEALTLAAPRLFTGDEYPHTPFNADFQLTWPKLMVPLRVGDVVVGLLCADGYGNPQTELTEAACEQVKPYLESLTQLLSPTQTDTEPRRKKWLERLDDIRLRLLGGHIPGEVFRAIVEAIAEFSQSDLAHLRVIEGDWLVLKYCHGAYLDLLVRHGRDRVPLRTSHSSAARVLQLGVPIFHLDYQRWLDNELKHKRLELPAEVADFFRKNIKSAAHFPIIADGVAIGSISLHSSETRDYAAVATLLLEALREASQYVSLVVLASRASADLTQAQASRRLELQKAVARMLRQTDETNLRREFVSALLASEIIGVEKVALWDVVRGPTDEYILAETTPAIAVENSEAQLPTPNRASEWFPPTVIETLRGLSDSEPAFVNLNADRISPFFVVAKALGYESGFAFAVISDDGNAVVGVGQPPAGQLTAVREVRLELGRELLASFQLGLTRLRLMREKEQQVWRGLVGLASHRLRSHIPPIMDQTEFAGTSLTLGDTADVERRLGIIRRFAGNAFELLEDFTRYSHLRVVLSVEWPVARFVDWLEQGIRERLPRLEMRFSSQIDNSEARVRLDPTPLISVLIELAQDSEKYARPASGRLQLSIQVSAAQTLRLIYEDNGQGIPPNVRPRLFQPFDAAEGVNTGLGLAIVSETVRLHGGRVSELRDPRTTQPPEQPAYPTGVRFLIELPLLHLSTTK